MEITKDFENEIKTLKDKFVNKTEGEILEELENSINIFRSLKCDENIETFNSFEKNWIKRCTIELLSSSIDKRNLKSYSENGFSETYQDGLISIDLKREIFPKARAIKR